MPAFNFKKQFAPLVKSGKKRQTIRALRKDGRDPRAGQTAYLYHNQRTPQREQLWHDYYKGIPPIIISVEPIAIFSPIYVFIGAVPKSVLLNRDEVYALAKADGLSDIESFMVFFRQKSGHPFEGNLIKW